MPMPDKKENPKSANITAKSGLSGQSVGAIHVWQSGSTEVIEVIVGSTSTFIKWKNGRCEVGGDANFGTGTIVL